MLTYSFRCGAHDLFEVRAPMGEAGGQRACPTCGGESRRVFAAPMLGLADRRVGAAVDRADKSRHEPEVVTSLPASGRRPRARPAPPNPALQRLPRP